MGNIIKEFIEWRKYRALFQKIDISKADKNKLDAFDREVLDKVYINTMNRLVS
jgi:hypothetical protein